MKDEMVQAICDEIDLRTDYLEDKSLSSIYLGGGTPSLLSEFDLDLIFERLSKHFTWNAQAEITLEANPDDLSNEKLKVLSDSQVNRLSIGVQSFDEVDLKYMNRAHNASEAETCIKQAQDFGFDNISADLIYGSPTSSDEAWAKNVEKMISFDIPHISAYALTVEEGTALHHFVESGKSKPVDDETAARQFLMLMDKLGGNGYDHYEISNFAKPDHYAVHNSNYWLGVPYLGLGPAAHSFDGKRQRGWNISHNPNYISSIGNKELPIELENLTDIDAYNEFVLIRLRTIWGITQKDLESKFPLYKQHFEKSISSFLNSGDVFNVDDTYTLTSKGKLIGDKISMELFVDNQT